MENRNEMAANRTAENIIQRLLEVIWRFLLSVDVFMNLWSVLGIIMQDTK